MEVDITTASKNPQDSAAISNICRYRYQRVVTHQSCFRSDQPKLMT